SRDRAQGAIVAELRLWDELAKDERDLNARSARRLDGTDLRSLRDHGWLEKQFEHVEKFFGRLGENIAELGEALVHGNLDDFLWALHDLMDEVLTIAAIVGFVAVVAAAAVGSGGAALPFLITAAAWTAAVASEYKLIAGVVLHASGSVNPKTGE